MARQTTNYGLTKPDYMDIADIEVVNSNMDIIDEALKVIDTKSNNVMSKNSSAWSSTTTYTVGQYCIYNNSLWKCLVQHSGKTPQEGTYWTKVSLDVLSDEVSSINQNLEICAEIIDRTYQGTDLTVKFADEIANYSDEWAWIKARINAGNYDGIHIGDYIPITCSNGYVLNAQIAGINTYTGYADQQVGNHIDFICKELWNDFHVMNKVNYNNGNVNSSITFLASDLNYWLNSMSGAVSNSTSDPSVTTWVDYTAGGVIYYLPDKLKNQIITKRLLLPSRYTAGQVLTNDNSWAWQSTGKLWVPSEVEVYGAPCWGNSGYGMGGFVQYPLFANNMNRAKLRCASKDHSAWWLLSACAGNSTSFATIHSYGTCISYLATTTWVAAPVCFRI